MRKNLFTFIILVTLSIISACSESEDLTKQNQDSSDDGHFTVENISTSSLKENEKYFFVIPIEWSGNKTAKIESIKIINNEKPINYEDGINYTFYGAKSDKKTGVYQRNSIGEKEDIKGFKIHNKASLILETSLKNVKTNKNRKIEITYEVNGKKQKQVIESSTFENLNTIK